MTGFSADWLALRAPADDAARDAGLMGQAVAWGRAQPGLRVLDLGAGSGATLRVLGPLLPGAAWWLADHDAALLDHACALARTRGETVTPLALDLASALDAAFEPRPHLVTASAFLDLAGAAWLDALADRVAASGAAFYAALSYDGHEAWHPPHPGDAAVHAAFAADMGRDKGLGPALGGAAAAHMAAALSARGLAVQTASSPWQLTPPRDAALIAALRAGTAAATGASADWAAAPRSRVEIGHLDVLALPR
jgi:hypothetical protein